MTDGHKYLSDKVKSIGLMPEEKIELEKLSRDYRADYKKKLVVFMILCQNLKYDNLRRQTWKQNLI